MRRASERVASLRKAAQTRYVVDRSVRYLLLLSALISIFIVFLIGLFTLREGLPAFREIGVDTMLAGRVWRPGRGEFISWR